MNAKTERIEIPKQKPGSWLNLQAERAERNIRERDQELLGPAARLLVCQSKLETAEPVEVEVEVPEPKKKFSLIKNSGIEIPPEAFQVPMIWSP